MSGRARGLHRVIERGWFILGPELEAFEREFAVVCGTTHAVGVGTGTDATGAGPARARDWSGRRSDHVTVVRGVLGLAIAMAGATPVFADLDPARLTLDPAATEAAITSRTAAIMPVHIYGQPADMPAFQAIASTADWRSSKTRARRTARPARTAGRHVRRRGRVQLLSDEESRRARRRRRRRRPTTRRWPSG